MSRESAGTPTRERPGRGAAGDFTPRDRTRDLLLAAGAPRPDTLVAWLWITGALVRCASRRRVHIEQIRKPPQRSA